MKQIDVSNGSINKREGHIKPHVEENLTADFEMFWNFL